MDHSRASSVYSSASENNSRTNSFRAAKDYAESMASSSAPSYRPSSRAVALGPSSTTPSSSRPSSARPSFMNYQNGAAAAQQQQQQRKPVPVLPAVEIPAPAAPVQQKAGTLLVVLGAGTQGTQTRKYIEIAMQSRQFSGVALVGKEDEELKGLKMEVYGIIGKLGRDVGVQTYAYEEGGILDAMQKAGNGDARGVLCELGYGSSTGRDILSAESDDLRREWESSVGVLHAVARATVPALTAGSEARAAGYGFFLVLEGAAQDAAAQLHQTATNTLLRQLRDTYSSPSLTFGYAANVLVALPEPVPTNGHEEETPPADVDQNTEPLDYGGGESPTKLWNMWSLQQEIGNDD